MEPSGTRPEPAPNAPAAACAQGEAAASRSPFRLRLSTLVALVVLAAVGMSSLDWSLRLRERWGLYEQAAAYHARLEQDSLRQEREQMDMVLEIVKVDDRIERTMAVFSPGQVRTWKAAEAQFVDEVRREASQKAAAAARRALFHSRKRHEFQTRWW